MTIDDGLADAEPFFIRRGDLLIPTERALGPWFCGARQSSRTAGSSTGGA